MHDRERNRHNDLLLQCRILRERLYVHPLQTLRPKCDGIAFKFMCCRELDRYSAVRMQCGILWRRNHLLAVYNVQQEWICNSVVRDWKRDRCYEVPMQCGFLRKRNDLLAVHNVQQEWICNSVVSHWKRDRCYEVHLPNGLLRKRDCVLPLQAMQREFHYELVMYRINNDGHCGVHMQHRIL